MPGFAFDGTRTPNRPSATAFRTTETDDGSENHDAGVRLTPAGSASPVTIEKVTFAAPFIFGAPRNAKVVRDAPPGARSSIAQDGCSSWMPSAPTLGVYAMTPLVSASSADGALTRPAPIPVTPTDPALRTG